MVHIWFGFSLSEPLCKESLHFSPWSPAKTPRIPATPGRWSLAQPPEVSTLHLLLGFSTVYTFISPKRRNFKEKKAREGARTLRAESKLREDDAFRALEFQQCPCFFDRTCLTQDTGRQLWAQVLVPSDSSLSTTTTWHRENWRPH